MLSFFFSRFRSKHAVVIICASSLLLMLPSLFAGFLADDYLHYALISGADVIKQANDVSLFKLFSFINSDFERTRQLIDNGLVPWWIYEGFRYNFFRPISELSHWVDYALWPQYPWIAHLQSLMWYGLLLLCLSGLYRRLSDTRLLALLALLLYAWDFNHGITVSWLSNRNAIIAAVFAVIALYCHDRSRRDGGLVYTGLSLLALTLSLFSAEIGISICAYLFAYALILDRKGLWLGGVAILPHGLLVVGWLVLYQDLGFGAAGSPDYYVDPVKDSYIYLSELVTRLPSMMMGQFGLIPADIFVTQTAGTITFNISLFLFFVFLLFSIPVLKDSKTSRFWLIACVLSALPVCSGIPQSRNLLLIGIGGAGFLSVFFNYWHEHLSSHKKPVVVAGRSVLWSLLTIHLCLSPLLLVASSYSTKLVAQPSINAALNFSGDLQGKKIAFLHAPQEPTVYFNVIRYKEGLNMPDRAWYLASDMSPVTVTRVAEHTLRITTDSGYLTGYETLVRTPEYSPMALHQSLQLDGLIMTVVALTEDGRPKTVEAHFVSPLEDILFLQWKRASANFEPLDLPLQGQELRISYSD